MTGKETISNIAYAMIASALENYEDGKIPGNLVIAKQFKDNQGIVIYRNREAEGEEWTVMVGEATHILPPMPEFELPILTTFEEAEENEKKIIEA